MNKAAIGTHKCHSTSCDQQIDTQYIMCFPHWRMLPRHVQTLITREFHNGLRHKCHPTEAYLTAVHEAVLLVEEAGSRG